MSTLEKIEEMIATMLSELEGPEYDKLTAYTSFVGNYLVVHVHNGDTNE